MTKEEEEVVVVEEEVAGNDRGAIAPDIANSRKDDKKYDDPVRMRYWSVTVSYRANSRQPIGRS